MRAMEPADAEVHDPRAEPAPVVARHGDALSAGPERVCAQRHHFSER
jgi:hypothetical protein